MSAEPMTRSRRRSRWYAPMALATAAALFLAACDSEDEEPAEETTTPVATSTGATASPTTTESTGTPEASPTTAEPMDDDHTVGVATEGDLAPYLVDAEGMTLYITSDDEEGVSNCVDACLDNWPPLLVEAGATPTASEDATGELGTIEREDGEGTQVTYNGMPLYYWAADAAEGDTTGHEVGGVWSVVTP